VKDLDPAVNHLKRASDEGNRLLDELSDTAPGLETTLDRVDSLAGPTTQAMPQLRKVLCQLNPAAEYLSPYNKDVAAMLTNMAAGTNFYDSTGHAARLLALAGPQSAAIYSDAMLAALNKLEDIGLVDKLTQRGYNPYPKPGEADETTGGDKASGPKDSQLKYHRVEADC
jgi:ABC-type transporter Mla subunit MlaD